MSLPFSGASSDKPLTDPVDPSTPIKLGPPRKCCETCARPFQPTYLGGDTLHHEEMLYRQGQRALRTAHRATEELRHRDLLTKWSWALCGLALVAGIIIGAIVMTFFKKG